MSGKSTKNKVRKSKGMKSNLGPAQTYMNANSKGKYARGAKKGSRRGQRRLNKEEISFEKESD